MKKPFNKIKLEGATFTYPHWSQVAKTYPEALKKVLAGIKASRPFYNWPEEQMDNFRETDQKKSILPIKGMITLTGVQFGTKYKGRSVGDVRKSLDKNEVPLGAYEVACALLAKPSLLEKYEDLSIDCPGDEFSVDGDGRFGGAPCFYFYDEQLKFDTYWYVLANDDYGSASAVLPQYLLDLKKNDTFEPLNFEISEIKLNGKTYRLVEE